MDEMLAATLSLPDAPVVRRGVTLDLVRVIPRYSLRAREARVVAEATGLPVPTRIGDYNGSVAMLGPDEWLALVDLPLPGLQASAPFSIVDVSSRAIGITLTGPAGTDLLSAGCPLDLARMAPGRATRTLFETVEIILIHPAEEQFHIEVWRSFGPWLFAALVAAALA